MKWKTHVKELRTRSHQIPEKLRLLLIQYWKISAIQPFNHCNKSNKKISQKHKCITALYGNVAGKVMYFTCGKGEHLWGTDLPFKHVHSKGFWLLNKRNYILFFKWINSYVKKSVWKKQTHTTLAAFLSTPPALVATSVAAADFSNTAYELRDRNQHGK